jgi:hypothetical protein
MKKTNKLKEHTETLMISFDTNGGLSQSEEIMYVNTIKYFFWLRKTSMNTIHYFF